MKKIYLLLISIILLTCKNQEKNVQENNNTKSSNEIVITKQQFENEDMQLGQLTKQPFNTFIKTSGVIDVPPENKSEVSSFIGGYITKIPLLVGDRVKKGQLLATLENPEFIEIQQQYLEISEQLHFLENENQRQKKLFDENITSQKNYLKAESVYKSGLASYNGLRKKLQMINISPMAVEQGQLTSTINLYAPITGYVTKVNVSNGSYISSASELLEIVNTDHIHLELTVFEKDILKIEKEQKIKFKVPEATNTIYDARVHLVGTSINEDRTIKIHGHIENDENINFIVGMFVEADIITDSLEHLALPNEAIYEIDNKYFALVLEKRTDESFTFKKVKLDIGSRNENYSEVLNTIEIENKDLLIKGNLMGLIE